MKFEQWQALATAQVKQYCEMSYGHVGSHYLVLLVIQEGKIVPIGEVVYSMWQDYHYDQSVRDMLPELGRQAQLFLEGKRTKMPSLSWKDSKPWIH